jgi:hypothetical protein
MSRRLYVLVRKDLPKNQAAVQAGHCLAEYLLRGPHSFWGNETLIYLVVKDEENLNEWVDKMTNSGYIVVGFREPDRDNELTAIAVECAPELVEDLRLF